MFGLEERHNYILKQLNEKGSIRVSEISEVLNCSEVTIRNDIRTLDQQGRLRKVHGGAEAKDNKLVVEFEQGDIFYNQHLKSAIANKAYEFINSRDSIILDDSTTSYYLALAIKNNPQKKLTVITNSVLSASVLASAHHVELFIVSGHVAGSPPRVSDNIAIDTIRQFNVNKAFIGTSGINLEKGISSLSSNFRDVKKVIIDCADEVYLITDHSKFYGKGLFFICPTEELTRIITDSEIAPEIVEKANEMNIPLVIA